MKTYDLQKLEKIEKEIGYPDDDRGQFNRANALYGSELSLNLEREGFSINIQAVDSLRFRHALLYLRALFPKEFN